MSCDNCEKIQETFVDSENEIYIRVGIANVQIIACPVHSRALIDTYRKGLDKIQEEHIEPIKVPGFNIQAPDGKIYSITYTENSEPQWKLVDT